jgi:hypothetical protein
MNVGKTAGCLFASLVLSSLVLTSSLALACDPPTSLPSEAVPEWARSIATNPESPQARAFASQQKARQELDRQLKKLRYEHFRATGKAELREAGLAKLRKFTDPAAYPLLVDNFVEESVDTRRAVLDMLLEQRAPDADTTLAWVTVFGKSESSRADANERLFARAGATGTYPDGAPLVVYQGLKHGTEQQRNSSAVLASGLKILEAIPWLIDAQGPSVQTAGIGNTNGGGVLAYILVGRQVAFVSGLTPVVSDSAVAFDPQVSVATEGSLLKIGDAVVTTVSGPIHDSLIQLTSAVSGRDTTYLGYDTKKWHEWYATELRPLLARREAERRLAEAAKTGSK